MCVTMSGKTGLIATITDTRFLSVHESCTHALPRNTKYLIMDGQVCFYRRLFTDAVKPLGCISWPCRVHALPRSTKYLIIDGQVCFYRWLFTDAVKPQRCILWPWRALCMGYKTAPKGNLGLPCGLYQFMSHTEGAALLFESERVL